MSIYDNVDLALNHAVSDEWLANTYSEYLNDCAAETLKLTETIKTKACDETLQNIIDAASDTLTDVRASLRNYVLSMRSSLDKPVFELSIDSPDYIASVETFFQDNSTALTAIRQLMHNNALTPAEAAQLLLDNSDDEIILVAPSYSSRITLLVTEVMQECELDANDTFCFNEGAFSISDCASILISDYNLKLPSGKLVVSNPIDSLGNVLSNITLTATEVNNQFNNIIASTVTWAAGFASSCIANIADMTSRFNTAVSNVISSATHKYQAVKSTVSKALESARGDVRSFIQCAESMFGIYKFNEPNAITIGDTFVAQYTGANPLSAVNLKAATGFATVTGALIYTAGVAIWNGVKTIAAKLWKKAKPYLKNLTSNPTDIYVSDPDAESYTVQDFQFQGEIHCDLQYPGSFNLSTFRQYVRDHILHNKYCFKNIFGEAIIELNSFLPIGNLVLISAKYCLKFKSINFQTAKDSGLNRHPLSIAYSMPTFNFGGYNNAMWIQALESFRNSGSMYNAADASEESILRGFQMAMMAMFGTVYHSCRSMYQANTANSISKWTPGYQLRYGNPSAREVDLTVSYDNGSVPGGVYRYITFNHKGNVTNKDFLEVGTGYHEWTNVEEASYTFNTIKGYYAYSTTQANGMSAHTEIVQTAAEKTNPYYENINITYDNSVAGAQTSTPHIGNSYTYTDEWLDGFDVGDIVSGFVVMMLNQAADKWQNRNNYKFIPYSKEDIMFSPATYTVKTDQTNMNITNVFYSVIVVVAVVIVSILAVKIAKRKITNAKLAKLTTKKEQLTAKVWDGHQLTATESRRMKRWSNKIDKINSSDFISQSNDALSLMDPVKNVVSSFETGTLNGSESPTVANVLTEGEATLSAQLDQIMLCCDKTHATGYKDV